MQEIPLWMREIETWATIFQAFLTPILIAIGGFFAWYKFFRQGEHDPRLQPSVSSEVTVKGSTAYIVATVSVQNTGLVDVNLDLESCGLLVLTRQGRSGWRDPDTVYDVFLRQSRVQTNAALEDRIWIERTLTDEVAVCLELAVQSEGGPAWRTSEIISLVDGGHLSQDG